jgi:hypothetical protein
MLKGRSETNVVTSVMIGTIEKVVVVVVNGLPHNTKPWTTFTALCWLRDYLVKKVGAINQLHVDQWRTCITCEGETPMDAFAKLRDDTMVLGNAGSVVSFIPDVELLRQVSQKTVEFFPTPLYDRILPIVKLRISNDASNSQTAKMCAIWVETAHEEFTDLPAKGS